MNEARRTPVWHLLQLSGVLDLELAAALADLAPVIAWKPLRTFRALRVAPGHERELSTEPHLRIREMPLLPGNSRLPFNLLRRIGTSITQRLLRQTAHPESSPLICTVPYFAFVAKQWPGPVVYWLTDFIAEYESSNRAQVEELDRLMCKAATLVCPNSERIAQYLITRASCSPARIQVLPNATRSTNVFPLRPSPRAEDHAALSGIERPIAGIIGNLAGNTDWLLLQRLLELDAAFSWVMIGPSSMRVEDSAQSAARAHVMRHPSTHFLGPRNYGDLGAFARAFDVAVLPYIRREPTRSGSSTRFYEHLAACRPMIVTGAPEELTRKPPLLKIADSAEHAAELLSKLRDQNFDDGFLELRWRTSKANTWHVRAQSMQDTLFERLAGEGARVTTPVTGVPILGADGGRQQ